MPRPIEPRASYTADAGFLNRLLQSVEKDVERPTEWRKNVITHLQKLIVLFVVPPTS